jgi:hypothetical protein
MDISRHRRFKGVRFPEKQKLSIATRAFSMKFGAYDN